MVGDSPNATAKTITFALGGSEQEAQVLSAGTSTMKDLPKKTGAQMGCKTYYPIFSYAFTKFYNYIHV